MTTLDVAARQGRLPDPRARGATASASCTSTRPHVAEAARGARRDGALLPQSTTPTSTAASTASPRRPPPRSKAPGPRSRGSSTRRTRRDRVHQERHRGASTSSPTRGAAPTSRAGDASCSPHMEHHANIVPWHMLAAERGVELRWIPLTADGRLDLTDLDRAARRRQAASPSPRCRTCSARINADPPARRRRPRRRRARAGRRVPGRPPHRHRRAGLGRRLRRLHRPQDVRPDRHRRALGRDASCSRRCRRSSAAAR